MGILCYIFDACTTIPRYSNEFTGAIRPRVSKSQSGPSPATSLESNCYPNSIETMLPLRVKSARQAPTTTAPQPNHLHLKLLNKASHLPQERFPTPKVYPLPLTAMCCLFTPASHPHNFLASYCRERFHRYAYQSARSGCFAFGTTVPAAQDVLKGQPTCLMNTNRRTEWRSIYHIWHLASAEDWLYNMPTHNGDQPAELCTHALTAA
jgi:hypothetical protein